MPDEVGAHLVRVLLAVALLLPLAKVAGDLALRAGMPSVLGELIAGIAVGNLVLLGLETRAFLEGQIVLEILAEIGAILLLFDIGLRSDVRKLLRVGLSSLLVAVLGVVVPIGLGIVVARIFLPDAHVLVHLFVGATLCATSVGITARVLEEIGRVESLEGRIILGAAVIDDVLGLVVLAGITAAVAAAEGGGDFSAGQLGGVLLKVVGFFVLAIGAGLLVSRRLFHVASRLRGQGLLLAASLIFCFALSDLALVLGLAPIVGAFAAGLALDETTYVEFRDHGETRRIEEVIEPLASFLVPMFFVMMGVRVDLRALGEPGVPLFALALCVVAIVGKQACSLGVVEAGANRLAVGLGMVPRGEVGLIFAGIGASLTLLGVPVIAPPVYAALVLMVAFTTLLTPPLLARALSRSGDR
jgi:Kef-type K+ transport system membrane component KefB